MSCFNNREALINHDDIIEHSNQAGNNMVVSVPKHKLQPRRSSSKDLRGAVTRAMARRGSRELSRRQSSKDLRNILMRRQSSRDIVNGSVTNNVINKDPRVCLIQQAWMNILSYHSFICYVLSILLTKY